MADDKDKIILFPQNRIVNKRTKELANKDGKWGEVAKKYKNNKLKNLLKVQ